jgi:hypothetical protein
MPRRIAKPWFLTRAKEFTPTGTLQLGQILTKANDPASILMPYGPLPIQPGMLQERSHQTSVVVELKGDLDSMFGTWVDTPASGIASASMSRSCKLSWHFQKLTATTFSPSIAYLKAAIRHGDVPNYTGQFHLLKTLYIVTGVKIAHGARMEMTTSSSTGVRGELEADASEVAAVKGRVEGRVVGENEGKESFQEASDFVYAYRLNEISYWNELTQKPVVKGDFASVRDLDSEEEEEYEAGPCIAGLKQDSEMEVAGVEIPVLDSQVSKLELAGIKVFNLDSIEDPEVTYQCFVTTSKSS